MPKPSTDLPELARDGAVPKLGVGLLYQEPLRQFIETEGDCFDFLEVIPDILWADMGYGESPRYIEDVRSVEHLRRLSRRMTVVPHSIGFSIGSAHRFDREHIAQIGRWFDWLRFPWHSDHLAFMLAEHGGVEVNAGVTLPLPFDQETIDLLTPRVREMRERVPVPFLLETNVYFFNYPRQDFDEPTFLNRLCETSGCRLLLDLHNLYTNSRNLSIDPFEFLERLDLANVIEIHVAGGMELDGFYQDAHCGTSPEEVWRLLEWTLARSPNVGGVVFEMLGSWYVDVGAAALRGQLSRMRELWMRYQPAPESACEEVLLR